MKKLFALIMSFAMVLSMAAVSFAALPPEEKFDERNYIVMGMMPKTDGKFMRDGALVGNSVYYPIILAGTDFGPESDANAPISEYGKEFKVSAKFDQGGDVIEEVKITNKIERGKPMAFVEIFIKDDAIMETKDVIGTVTIKAKKAYGLLMAPGTSFDDVSRTVKMDVAFEVKPRSANAENTDVDSTDKETVYTFGEGMEEQTVNLYGGMGRFDVNTIGQGDLVISSNVDYNKGIENISSDCAYYYFNGNGAAFNRLGSLYLSAYEEDTLYKVNEDGTITEIEVEYSEDDVAFKLRTRTIGSYIVAEKPLDVEKINADILKK